MPLLRKDTLRCLSVSVITLGKINIGCCSIIRHVIYIGSKKRLLEETMQSIEVGRQMHEKEQTGYNAGGPPYK